MNFVCHFFNVAKLSPSVLLCDRSSQFTHVWCEETFLMILGQDQDFSDPGLLPWLPSLSRPHQSLWYSLGTWMTLCPKKCSINLVWAARDCVLITVPERLVTIFYSQLPFIQFLFTSQGLCRIHFFSYLLSPMHALGIKPLLTSTKSFKIKRWKVFRRSL